MRLKLLTSRVLGNGQVQSWGDTIETDDKEGQRLIAAGQAERVAEPARGKAAARESSEQ